MDGRKRLVATAAVALLLGAAQPAWAQCAMCRTALSSPEGQRMIAALRSGIIVLLAAPFAVFATVAIAAMRRFRRDAARSVDGGKHERFDDPVAAELYDRR